MRDTAPFKSAPTKAHEIGFWPRPTGFVRVNNPVYHFT